MALFNLPTELVRLIFRFIFFSRKFHRAMRIRLVNHMLRMRCACTPADTLSLGQFRFYIDDIIFDLRLLYGIVAPPHSICAIFPFRGRKYPAWSSYVFSYLEYQARREGPTTSFLGRVYRAAQALCEDNDDEKAFGACLKSVIRFASSYSISRLLQESIVEPKECTNSRLEADLAVAAVCLGRKSYIEQLIAQGTQFCSTDERIDVYSGVFGYAFKAATRQGDVEVIKLLLSCTPEYRDAGTLSRPSQARILADASSYGHRAAFNFALDTRPINLPEKQMERPMALEYKTLKRALRDTPWPDNFERVAAILGPKSLLEPPKCSPLTPWLTRSVSKGQEEMVCYFLSKGAPPNPVGAHINQPLRSALCHRQQKIFKILVDAGADPSLHSGPEQLLMHAVWIDSIPLTQLLLDCGLDINEGFPCPIALAVFKENIAMFRMLRERGARLDTPETGGWAMALALMHGLDSMADLLMREGMVKDYILHHVGLQREFHLWQRRLWPVYKEMHVVAHQQACI